MCFFLVCQLAGVLCNAHGGDKPDYEYYEYREYYRWSYGILSAMCPGNSMVHGTHAFLCSPQYS